MDSSSQSAVLLSSNCISMVCAASIIVEAGLVVPSPVYAQDQQHQQPEQHAGFMNRMKSLVGASSNAPGRSCKQVVVHSSCLHLRHCKTA